jgi:uncharacterized protein
MKYLIALIAMFAFGAGSGFAQAPAAGTPGSAPAQPPAPASQAKPAQPGGSSAAAAPAAAPAPAPAEKVDPAKDAAIRHLMEITETSKMGDRISNMITMRVRSVMSQALPQDQLEKFMESFSDKFSTGAPPSAVTDAIIPIYSRHFSMEDVQNLIQFYESPLGQRVVKNLPIVAQESQEAGLEMDQKAAMGVLRGMSDDYPQLKQILPPDHSKPEAAPAPKPSPAPSPAPNPPNPPHP